MTIEEMREMIDKLMNYCNRWVDCESCPLHDLGYCGNKVWSDFTNNEIVECYRTVFGAETTSADQSIKADAGKARLTLVPQQILWDIAEVRAYGLKKYGSAENWKKVEPVENEWTSLEWKELKLRHEELILEAKRLQLQRLQEK